MLKEPLFFGRRDLASGPEQIAPPPTLNASGYNKSLEMNQN